MILKRRFTFIIGFGTSQAFIVVFLQLIYFWLYKWKQKNRNQRVSHQPHFSKIQQKYCLSFYIISEQLDQKLLFMEQKKSHNLLVSNHPLH